MRRFIRSKGGLRPQQRIKIMARSIYLETAHNQTAAHLRIGELLGSLSYALDMTEGQPLGHCIRCCWIGSKIGEELGLSDQELSDLYFVLLLKDLGCSSNAARICELYLTDDIAFKHDFKLIDQNISAVLRFVLSKTGMKSGLAERVRAIVHIFQNGQQISSELIQTRCDRGAQIAAKMRFSDKVQQGIRHLDEHWSGGGKPSGIKGDEISILANIALLAQIIDVFYIAKGKKAAIDEAKLRESDWFNPQIVAAFLKAQENADFWAILKSDQIEQNVFSMAPALQSALIDDDYLDEIAAAFSDVVDAKSHFTADHSNRVTLYTDMIAEELGLSLPHRRWLSRAALMHDVGKLSVSNQILDKPGKPDEEEWTAIKKHALYSEEILERVEAFKDIAPIAGAHHERLDGKGYPHGLKGDELCLEVRILTVADVFDALTADRPYRAAMEIKKAMSIITSDIGTAFDEDCVKALERAIKKLNQIEGKVA